MGIHLALLRIAQDIVRLLYVLEAFFGGLIARVEIGMVLARELTISLADIIRGSFPLHAERFIVFVLGRHI